MGKCKNFIFLKLVIISYKNRNIIANEDEMSQNEDEEEIVGGDDGQIPNVTLDQDHLGDSM